MAVISGEIIHKIYILDKEEAASIGVDLRVFDWLAPGSQVKIGLSEDRQWWCAVPINGWLQVGAVHQTYNINNSPNEFNCLVNAIKLCLLPPPEQVEAIFESNIKPKNRFELISEDIEE